MTGVGEWNLLSDLNAKALETNDLTRVIRQQMDRREAQVGQNLSADSGVVLHGLVTNVGRERGLIPPVSQQFSTTIARHAQQAGSRLMEIEKDAARCLRYFAETPLDQLVTVTI